MSSRQLKQEAQASLMQWVVNGILAESEYGKSDEHLAEMNKQAIRIMKMFGYESWPGIEDSK